MFSLSNPLNCPNLVIWVKKKSGTSIIARFGDNSDSMILKFLKFLTKLLAHFSRNSGVCIKVLQKLKGFLSKHFDKDTAYDGKFEWLALYKCTETFMSKVQTRANVWWQKNASVNLLEVFVFSWIFALDNGSRGRLCLSAHSPPKNTNSAATTQCTNNW